MYQNASEKGLAHSNPLDPPRRRANKQRGHGNFDNDRPPVVGVIGRQSQQVALQVRSNSSKDELKAVVESATQAEATVNTNEWRGYNWLDQTNHAHPKVNHTPGQREWARDANGDGVREVHTNTIEGFWTGLRNFLRPFRGVSKHYLAYYIAVYAWIHNFSDLNIIHLLRCLMVNFTAVPS
jgi:transposase-like protein